MPLFQTHKFPHSSPTQQNQSSLQRLLLAFIPRAHHTLTVAATDLSRWASHLRTFFAPPPPPPTQPTSTPLAARLSTLHASYPAAAYTTVGAFFLALLYLATRYLMTSYRSDIVNRRQAAGRHSPYASSYDSRPSNLFDYVEYVVPESTAHYVDDYHRPSVARPHTYPVEAEDAPDVLLLRNKGELHPLHFPPYAISDGFVTVQMLRSEAAQTLRTTSNRIKMSYKGNRLTRDDWSAKEYGLKQNSEITVVVSEGDSDSLESYSGTDDDSGSAVSTSHDHGHRRHHHHHSHPHSHSHSTRPRGRSTARHRSEVQIPEPVVQSSYLHPSSAGAGVPRPSRAPERSSGDSLHSPTDYSSRVERVPSRSRQPSPAPPVVRQSPPPSTTAHSSSSTTPAPPVPTTSTTSSVPAPSATGPSAQLAELSSKFENVWRDPCEKFITSPPTDPTARDKEHARLAESVMTQILIKADQIDLQGDTDLRKVRKRLIDDANGLLRKLDAAK